MSTVNLFTADTIHFASESGRPRTAAHGVTTPEGVTDYVWDAETLTASATTEEGEWSHTFTEGELTAILANPASGQVPQNITLEEWLTECGYTAMQIVSLKEYEHALAAAEIPVTEVTATRAWFNALNMRYASGTTRATDWAAPPYAVEAVVSAAATALTT